jgi:hypothetical protein
MSNLINDPIFLSLFFPALSLFVCVPLLRWALNGEKRDIYASVAISLGVVVSAVLATGGFGKPFDFGIKAFAYSLAGIGFVSLLACLFLKRISLLFSLHMTLLAFWAWAVLGFPIDNLPLLWGSAFVLILIGSTFLHHQFFKIDVTDKDAAFYRFLSLFLMNAVFGVYAYWVGYDAGFLMALSLCALISACFVFYTPMISMTFQQNGYVSLILVTMGLGWSLWVEGGVSLLSVLSVYFVFFTTVVFKAHVWTENRWGKALKPFVFIAISSLPVFLGFLLFDILRQL